MTLVRASIDIDAPRERVYDYVLDPGHLDDWVSIHRRINSRDAGPPREGYEMEQTLHLRGANIKVRWTLTELQEDAHVTWEGRGPAHSYTCPMLSRVSRQVTRARATSSTHTGWNLAAARTSGITGNRRCSAANRLRKRSCSPKMTDGRRIVHASPGTERIACSPAALERW